MVRNEAGEAVWTMRPPPEDLDALPDPDYDGPEWPEGWASPEFPVLLSRGCIGRCAFCDVFSRNGRFRLRSPERVFEEIRKLRETYPELRVHFNDSLINGSPRHLRRLCELLIAGGIEVPMLGQARARKDMTVGDFDLMRRAGFHRVIYGIETGSETVRQLMNKTQGGSLDEVAECMAKTHDAGLHVSVNLIVGFPGETRRELEETATFLLRNRTLIDSVATIAPMVVLPDSPVYREPERYGVAPDSIHSHEWRTLDGSNTLAERIRRKDWLRDRLHEGGFDLGPLIEDTSRPEGPPRPLVERVVGRVRNLFTNRSGS